jgi:UDP-N-acetylglucosamine 2-epimerase (non-hydrolysing)
MTGYEKVLMREKSDMCLVVGDVTSTMACAITAQKLHVPVAHVEGGIRSGDWTMPEEINRLATDAVTNWFFTTSETANENLRHSGVADSRIFFVGNTMIDTLLYNLPRLKKPDIWEEVGLMEKQYVVLTLHRPGNVDHEQKLKKMIRAVSDGTGEFPVIFPAHPRTAENLKKMGEDAGGLHLTRPMGYLEFNFLVKNALAVITDSGGITEETTVLGIPCMTLRDSTERPETITLGTNELVGTNPENLGPFFDRLFAGKWKKGAIPPLWDGKTGQRIVECLTRLV